MRVRRDSTSAGLGIYTVKHSCHTASQDSSAELSLPLFASSSSALKDTWHVRLQLSPDSRDLRDA